MYLFFIVFKLHSKYVSKSNKDSLTTIAGNNISFNYKLKFPGFWQFYLHYLW